MSICVDWKLVPLHKWENGVQVMDRDHPNLPYQRFFWIDPGTNDRYADDSTLLLRAKFVQMIIGLALFTLVHVVWHVARMVFLDNVKSHLYALVTTPFFVTLIALNALSGLICPLDARKRMAWIERLWHGMERDPVRASVCGCQENHPFGHFLAPCMQPVNDRRYVAIQETSKN